MLTNEEWIKDLNSYGAIASVGVYARKWLSEHAETSSRIPTRTLVEALWPLADCTDVKLRSKLWQNYLPALAEGALADCASRGEPVTRRQYGKTYAARPWLWHAPKIELTVCPNCGHRLDVV